MLPSIQISFRDGRPDQHVQFVQSINFVMGRCVIRAVGEDPIGFDAGDVTTIELEPKAREPLSSL